jgi:hypothetical protein
VSDEKTLGLEEIEKRRAARRARSVDARAAQHLKDMAALDALEEEHGESRVKALHVKHFVSGLPTFLVVKSPGGTGYYKRFADQIRAAKGNKSAESAAQDMLAESSIVYPTDKDVRAAMLAEFPNMLNDAALAAIHFVTLEAEDEKKG